MIYTVEQGKRDFKPFNLPCFTRRTKGFVLEYRLLEGTNVSPPLDNEMDWNKLLGVSFELFRNNRNAVMGAFRWNPIKNTREVCVYANWNGGNYPIAICSTGVSGRIEVSLHRNGLSAHIVTDEEDRHATLTGPSFLDRFSRTMGMWYGGTYPAPVRTKIECSIKVK